MLYRQSTICICGHSNLVHISSCWGKVNGKPCTCTEFIPKVEKEETLKKVKCSKCEYYSYQLQRCKNGKINPRTIKGGIEAANFMGLGYICGLSPLKEKIIKKILKGPLLKEKEGEQNAKKKRI